MLGHDAPKFQSCVKWANLIKIWSHSNVSRGSTYQLILKARILFSTATVKIREQRILVIFKSKR